MARQVRPRFLVEPPRFQRASPAVLGFLGATLALFSATASPAEELRPQQVGPPRPRMARGPAVLQPKLPPALEDSRRAVLQPVPRPVQALPPPLLLVAPGEDPADGAPPWLQSVPRAPGRALPPMVVPPAVADGDELAPILLAPPRQAAAVERLPPPVLRVEPEPSAPPAPLPILQPRPGTVAPPTLVIECPTLLEAGRDAVAVLQAGRLTTTVLAAARDATMTLEAGRDGVGSLEAARDASAELLGGKCLAKTAQNDVLYAGNKRLLDYVIVDSDDPAEPPLDITGGTVKWVLTKLKSDGDPRTTPPILAKSSPSSGVVLTDAANGAVRVTIDPVDTAALTPGDYYHELELVDSSGDPYVVATGTVTIRPNVQDT